MGISPRIALRPIRFTRDMQDAYALASLGRGAGGARGRFDWEITPVDVKSGKTRAVVASDELPAKAAGRI